MKQPAAPPSVTAPPLYVVLHIYKTAGKTLLRQFEQNLRGREFLSMYAPRMGLDKAEASANPGWNEALVLDYLAAKLSDNIRCVFGHMAFYGIHELPQVAGREVRYIVFVRDPVARIVSLYNYLRHHSDNAWHQEIIDHDWSLEQWFQNSRGLWLHDGQLRQLLLWHRKEVLEDRYLTAEHLELGKKILEDMWFIGATETFAADLQVLCNRLGFKQGTADAVVNASRGEKAIGKSTNRMIREDNALDAGLVDHALALRSLPAGAYDRADDQRLPLARPRATGSRLSALIRPIRLPWR